MCYIVQWRLSHLKIAQCFGVCEETRGNRFRWMERGHSLVEARLILGSDEIGVKLEMDLRPAPLRS